jgi:hypothetical protein
MIELLEASHSDSRPYRQLNRALWAELNRAAGQSLHPWRTPVLVTGGTEPSGRVVVLREADAELGRLLCYTDRRTPKVTALRSDSRVTWVFYHPEHRIQIRASGRTTLHQGDALADLAWRALLPHHRREYTSAAPPGTALDPTQPAQPHSSPSENFTVLSATVEEMDWLRLLPDGHQRIHFSSNSGWSVVP